MTQIGDELKNKALANFIRHEAYSTVDIRESALLI